MSKDPYYYTICSDCQHVYDAKQTELLKQYSVLDEKTLDYIKSRCRAHVSDNGCYMYEGSRNFPRGILTKTEKQG